MSAKILRSPEIDGLIAAGAVVAIGVSGGKDSQATAITTIRHLDSIGHQGPRVLIHADLGSVEWSASLPVCRALAEHLGLELIVTGRPAGGLMERWESRWAANVARYINLESVALILPWSTPAMRFCTSELKTHPILSALRKRFPGQPMVNVTGQRRQESNARAKLPAWSFDERNSRQGAPILNWRPILDLKVEDVFAEIAAAGLVPHEAYTKYGSRRVSCAFCIMSSRSDMAAAARAPENQGIYRRMVALELRSGFAFQGGPPKSADSVARSNWLCDVAPDLLAPEVVASIPDVKLRAQARVDAERTIPKELLYVKGWPTFVPSLDQGALIADVRRRVAAATGLQPLYLDAESVVARYSELFAMKHPEAA